MRLVDSGKSTQVDFQEESRKVKVLATFAKLVNLQHFYTKFLSLDPSTTDSRLSCCLKARAKSVSIEQDKVLVTTTAKALVSWYNLPNNQVRQEQMKRYKVQEHTCD